MKLIKMISAIRQQCLLKLNAERTFVGIKMSQQKRGALREAEKKQQPVYVFVVCARVATNFDSGHEALLLYGAVRTLNTIYKTG